MQIYGLKLFNLFRFGETENSVVFDISTKDKVAISEKKLTIDEVYDRLKADPIKHIKKVKEDGITGLIAISGILGNNKSRSNGAGKSSIMESICYANYDRIVRKNLSVNSTERAGLSVVPKFNGKYPTDLRESYVEEIFEERGKVYRLKRGRTFSKGQKSHTPVVEFECINENDVDSQAGHRTGDTNDAITDVINMDYDVFINSVMFGQNDAGKFLTGTDKTKKEMLINLLRLEEIVSSCLASVRKRKNSKEKEIEGFRAQAEMIEDALDLKDDTKKLQNYILAKADEATALLNLISKNEDTIKELSESDDIVRITKIKDQGKKVQTDLKNKQEDLESQTKAWLELLNTSNVNLASVRKKLPLATQEASRIDSERISLKKSIDEFSMDGHNARIEKASKALEALSKYKTFLDESHPKHDKIITDIATLNVKISMADEEHAALQKQIDEVGEGENFICDKCKSVVTKEHTKNLIAENRTSRFVLNKEVTDSNKKIEALNAKIEEANQRRSMCNEFISDGKSSEYEIKLVESEKLKLLEMNKGFDAASVSFIELNAEENLLSAQNLEYSTKCKEIESRFADDIKRLNEQLVDLREQLKTASSKASKIQAEIHSLRELNNTKREAHSTCMSVIGSLRKEIQYITENRMKLKEINESKKDGEETLNRLLILEDVFGLEGIQISIIKKYLPLFNVYIKEFLNILSDGEMIVELYVNDKLHIDMRIQGGSAGTYEMLSGGEKVIARLAVDIAMAMVSFSRSSQKPEIICLDEIFSDLDDSHTDAVFKLIEHLKSKFSRVLVISHEQAVNDLIENQIVVRRGIGDFARSSIYKII